jgi:hypothetical protein
MQNVLIFSEARKGGENYFREQRRFVDYLDHFHKASPSLLLSLQGIKEKVTLYSPPFEVITALQALLERQVHPQNAPKGIDEFINMRILSHSLSLSTSTNCSYSIDRSSVANATDKAQYAYRALQGHSFFPQQATQEARELFKVLYSMYLIWEEPQITLGLSMGFMGEKYFTHFIHKDSEATRYLMEWVRAS